MTGQPTIVPSHGIQHELRRLPSGRRLTRRWSATIVRLAIGIVRPTSREHSTVEVSEGRLLGGLQPFGGSLDEQSQVGCAERRRTRGFLTSWEVGR